MAAVKQGISAFETALISGLTLVTAPNALICSMSTRV